MPKERQDWHLAQTSFVLTFLTFLSNPHQKCNIFHFTKAKSDKLAKHCEKNYIIHTFTGHDVRYILLVIRISHVNNHECSQ